VLGYINYTSGNVYHYKSNVITVSGTTITIGSNADINASSNASYTAWEILKLTTTSYIAAYSRYDGTNGWFWALRAGSISGTTITYGSEVTWLVNPPYAYPHFKFIIESTTLGHMFGTNDDGGFSYSSRPVTISGTSLSLGSVFTTPSNGIPSYYFGEISMHPVNSTTMYMTSQQGSNPLYVSRVIKDGSYSPARWTNQLSKHTTSTNNLTTVAKVRSFIYSTGTVDRLCVVNTISGGLAGSGAGLAFFDYNNTTNSWSQTPYSFLIPSTGLNNHDSFGNKLSGLFRNTNGDLWLPYKNTDNTLRLMQIGLAQV
jgi:hypothetical protein